MFGRRYIKEIRGIVFLDCDNNSVHDDSEQLLKDIGIKLYLMDNPEAPYKKGEEIRIFREKHISSTKTNSRGEFRFLVNEGTYSVNLDIDTLPIGKGVVEGRIIADIGKKGSINFVVRDAASIDLYNKPDSILIGEHFILNPIVRDIAGNILAAKTEYSSDSDEIGFCSNECRSLPGSLKKSRVTIHVGAGSIKKHFPVDIEVPELCSTDKINLAHRIGMIDARTKILNHLYSLYDKRKLPDEYRSRIPVKSGTTTIEEIKRYMGSEDADRKTVEMAERYLYLSVPGLDRIYKSASGYFDIHYTTSGENAAATRDRRYRTVPPYIEQVGAALDNVKAIVCDTRGFREPIPDKGKKALDVYIFDLKGKYGITYASDYHSAMNAGTRTASCHICMDNDYSREKGFDRSREDCMKVTAAHEFFHAVQYAYNADADSWWKEASATWNEDEIYDEVNDYIRYLSSYFSSPQKSLDESSYSGVVFVKYLSENLGGYNIVKRIWEIQSTMYNNSVNAIDAAIREKYAKQDIGTVFNEFTACNFSPAQYYKEGAYWKTPIAVENTYNSYPVAMVRGRLNHLASDYQLFKPAASLEGKALKIVVHGEDGARWGFKIQSRKHSDKLCYLTEVETSEIYNRAEITLENFNDTYDEVCLIPANIEKRQDELSYNYSASV